VARGKGESLDELSALEVLRGLRAGSWDSPTPSGTRDDEDDQDSGTGESLLPGSAGIPPVELGQGNCGRCTKLAAEISANTCTQRALAPARPYGAIGVCSLQLSWYVSELSVCVMVAEWTRPTTVRSIQPKNHKTNRAAFSSGTTRSYVWRGPSRRLSAHKQVRIADATMCQKTGCLLFRRPFRLAQSLNCDIRLVSRHLAAHLVGPVSPRVP
jgi:hypothetical protein